MSSACFVLCFFSSSSLTSTFNSQVSPDQVMLSHSPLRMFTQFHKMRVLVSGQGPVEEVAHKYPVLNLGLPLDVDLKSVHVLFIQCISVHVPRSYQYVIFVPFDV